MLQAEVGGARVVPAGEKPRVGQRLRDFALLASNGKVVQLSELRGRRSLALVFVGAAGLDGEFLAALARSVPAFEEEEGQVLVVMVAPVLQVQRALERNPLPFPVLADTDGGVHRSLGALPEAPGSDAAVYVTDRFGEIFAVWRTADGQAIPQPWEIVEWFRYLAQLCPECEPPEWPKE